MRTNWPRQSSFHLGYVPWLTLTIIAALPGIFHLWQQGGPNNLDGLLQQGGMHRALLAEQGDWWRLLSANFVHVSWWHVAANCIFLLNIGAPAEAAFGFRGTLAILLASALGTTTSAALAAPYTTTAGASGLVFGLWGAAAVYGWRHRRVLPDRYRAYFLRGLLPYAGFALYAGLTTPGVDNFGHAGGLVVGSMFAALMPLKHAVPPPSRARRLLPLGAVAMPMLAALLIFPNEGHLPLAHSATGHHPQTDVLLPTPAHWHQVTNNTWPEGGGSYAYDNGFGVGIGAETRPFRQPLTHHQHVTRFVNHDLSETLAAREVLEFDLEPPQAAAVANRPATLVRARLRTPDRHVVASFYLVSDAHRRTVISHTAPLWLSASYAPLFATMLEQATFRDRKILHHAAR